MIQVTQLTVSYPDRTKALDNLSFSVDAGECVAIVGANGAGKSTLLLSLVGILMPEAGKIRVDGLEVAKNNVHELRRKVGMVFQNPDDQLFMPVIHDDIAFGPRNFGYSEEEVATAVEQALVQMNIQYLKDRSSLRLSGGEKRSAAIATVLAMSPSVMLFDEPSAFLDPRARRNLINTLKDLKQTKLIATHDLPLAVSACDRVLLLNRGSLFASGRPRELLFDDKLMHDCGLEAIERI